MFIVDWLGMRMQEIQPSNRVLGKIAKRVAKCQCVRCGRQKREQEKFRRGICGTCRGDIDRLLYSIAPSRRDATEKQLIRRGEILAPRQGARNDLRKKA